MNAAGALALVKSNPLALAVGGGALAALVVAHRKARGTGAAAPSGAAGSYTTSAPYDSSGVDAYNSIETMVEGLSSQLSTMSQQMHSASAARPAAPPPVLPWQQQHPGVRPSRMPRPQSTRRFAPAVTRRTARPPGGARAFPGGP